MPVLSSPRRPSLALAAAALCLIALPAEARRSTTAKPAPEQAEPAADAAKPGVSWTASESAKADCTRVRRKLWQPGEGWMVRTVSFCR